MNKKKLRQKDIVNLIFSYICLIAIAILCAGPFIWLLLSSLRTGANIYDLHFKLEDFTFSNYIGVIQYLLGCFTFIHVCLSARNDEL